MDSVSVSIVADWYSLAVSALSFQRDSLDVYCFACVSLTVLQGPSLGFRFGKQTGHFLKVSPVKHDEERTSSVTLAAYR